MVALLSVTGLGAAHPQSSSSRIVLPQIKLDDGRRVSLQLDMSDVTRSAQITTLSLPPGDPGGAQMDRLNCIHRIDPAVLMRRIKKLATELQLNLAVATLDRDQIIIVTRPKPKYQGVRFYTYYSVMRGCDQVCRIEQSAQRITAKTADGVIMMNTALRDDDDVTALLIEAAGDVFESCSRRV